MYYYYFVLQDILIHFPVFYIFLFFFAMINCFIPHF
jgi:hypothetical protein